MGFVNRNVENTNRKVLKVLETSKQNNEIKELVVEEYRYEGEVYSEGTPLEANSFETIVQEIIDNDLIERVSNDCVNLNISSSITNVITLPIRGINRSYIDWYVLSGKGITITNNQMSVNRDLKDQSCKIKGSCSLGEFIESKEFDVIVSKYTQTEIDLLPDLEKLNLDKNNISLPSTVSSNFTLPSIGECGTQMTWSVLSGDTITINNNYATIIPTVELTSNILKVDLLNGQETASSYYSVKVEAVSMTDEEIVSADLALIVMPDEVNSSFTLPSSGPNGSTFTWESLNENYIIVLGYSATVLTPVEDTVERLRVTATKNNITATRDFSITVLAPSTTDEEMVSADLASIVMPDEVNGSFTLPSSGPNGSTFTWESLNENYIIISGFNATVLRPVEDTVERLRVTATKNNITATRDFSITVLAMEDNDEEKAQQAANNISVPSSLSSNYTLPTTGLYLSTIEWEVKSGVNVSISNNTLIITKYLLARTIVLTATVTCGTSTVTKDFTITIEGMTDLEVVNHDAENLYVQSEVDDNFYVPTVGDLGSTITWDSSDTSIINFVEGEGIVTQGDSRYDLPIRAIITYGTASVEKFFVVSVLPLS